MKVLILAAGYGTRLSRDLEACSDQYSHLVGVPKPLLPVAGKPLISHWVDMLEACPETRDVKDIYVGVNAAFYSQFQKWSSGYPSVQIVNDGSHCNEERLGAVGSIRLAIQHFNIQDDLLVIGGDTLFLDDFSLTDYLQTFYSSPCRQEGGAFMTCYKCKNEDTVKLGILEVDENGRITSFLEKPSPEATPSRLACPCFYIFSKGCLEVIEQFLAEKEAAPLSERDATGHLIKYLVSRRPVYTMTISGRFDIGGLQTYLDCCQRFKPQTVEHHT